MTTRADRLESVITVFKSILVRVVRSSYAIRLMVELKHLGPVLSVILSVVEGWIISSTVCLYLNVFLCVCVFVSVRVFLRGNVRVCKAGCP